MAIILFVVLGKISCRCIYCNTIYAHKNATKCREHLVERCDKISSQIRSDISNQCEETPSRTWTQTRTPVWEHYIITEEDGNDLLFYRILCPVSN